MTYTSPKASIFKDESYKTLDYSSQKWTQKSNQEKKSTEDVIQIKNIVNLTADKMQEYLQTASLEAWMQTEKLIGKELNRQGIKTKIINPWEISQDSQIFYKKAIQSYAIQNPPDKLARLAGMEIETIRQKYTTLDPKLIGLVSMQFHYTGQILLKNILLSQRELVYSYFKVLEDYLYIPLYRTYKAAGKHGYDSQILKNVQKLLSLTTDIAVRIYQRVVDLYPNYYCFSGSLKEESIRNATIRDIETFQVYLCLCVLEDDTAAIEMELFPLCQLLYPSLKIHWELIRQMIHLLSQEINNCLGNTGKQVFKPHIQYLWELFNPSDFPYI
jgi:Phycobilisome protein